MTSTVNADGTDTFSYDDNGQLTATDSDYQTDENYSYDANGNRTNSGYDTGDNYRLLSDGTYDYQYDANGNRTRKTNIASGDYVEYAWDHRNRLVSVTFRNSSDVTTKEGVYKYDAFDRRIAKDVDDDGNGTFDRGERYVYDGSDIVLVFTDAGALTDRLLYGPAVNQPLASEDGSGDVRWMLADNQGTVRDVVEYDAGQDETNVVIHLQYGSFGNITGQTNSSEEPRHTYTGREWDADAELYYYRARWYDAVVGRFILEDPIGFGGGDENLSRYVHNRAPNFVDPTGWAEEPSGAKPGWWDGVLDWNQRLYEDEKLMLQHPIASGWGYTKSLGTGLGNMGVGIGKMAYEMYAMPLDVLRLDYELMKQSYFPDPDAPDFQPWSSTGEAIQAAQENGAAPLESVKPAALTVLTFGGYAYWQGAEHWYETGDPTYWQEASGPLLLIVIVHGVSPKGGAGATTRQPPARAGTPKGSPPAAETPATPPATKAPAAPVDPAAGDLAPNAGGVASPGRPFPANAEPGQTLTNIDPNTLQAGRGDLVGGRLAIQQELIQQGIPRTTPIKVTPQGVIWDGNHGTAAAAQAGVPVTVEVIQPPAPVPPRGPVTGLPVRQ